jgi:hypothetical protein
MDKRVAKYSVAWNPNTKSGYALIVLEGSEQPVRVPVNSPDDLTALAVVLRESPVYLRGTGMLYTGWEDVED